MGENDEEKQERSRKKKSHNKNDMQAPYINTINGVLIRLSIDCRSEPGIWSVKCHNIKKDNVHAQGNEQRWKHNKNNNEGTVISMKQLDIKNYREITKRYKNKLIKILYERITKNK